MKTQICTFKALKILVHYLAFNNNIPIYNLNTQRKILRKQGKPSQDNYHSNTFGKREGSQQDESQESKFGHKNII